MKFAAQVEYLGTHYHGWQRQQSGVVTVQSVVEAALSSVANEPVAVHCAGRTDTGVHALGQVIHFSPTVVRKPYNWLKGSNTFLPDDVRLVWVVPVAEDFHARFSATARAYEYWIDNRQVQSVQYRQDHTWVQSRLDADAMHEAGQYLLGEQDFSAFRAVTCQSVSPFRHVSALSVTRHGDRLCIAVTANAFLHHMVRNIAGVLLAIGQGVQPPVWAKQVLLSRDRTQGGVTAPPTGLRLVRVAYPGQFQLPGD